MFATPTYHPTLSQLGAMRLADMIEYAAQNTGFDVTELKVAACEGVTFPDIVTKDGRSTLVYHADLVGPDGVRYRSRFHEDRAATDWQTRNTLTIVTGYHEGIEHESKPIFGIKSHGEAREAALTYDKYMDALARS